MADITHPPVGPCANCATRPATRWWTGDGGALAGLRGYVAPWCERCCLVEKIKHAEARAAELPEMKRRLAEIDGAKAESVQARFRAWLESEWKRLDLLHALHRDARPMTEEQRKEWQDGVRRHRVLWLVNDRFGDVVSLIFDAISVKVL